MSLGTKLVKVIICCQIFIKMANNFRELSGVTPDRHEGVTLDRHEGVTPDRHEGVTPDRHDARDPPDPLPVSRFPSPDS